MVHHGVISHTLVTNPAKENSTLDSPFFSLSYVLIIKGKVSVGLLLLQFFVRISWGILSPGTLRLRLVHHFPVM